MFKNQGFSLIELIMVMLVITILAVMPLFEWPGAGINVAAQGDLFANDIRYAQTLAMSKQQRYRIVRASANTYQILNTAGTPALLPSGGTTMTLDDGIIFGSWGNLTNNLIEFDSRGTPYLAIGSTPLSAGTTYQISLTGGGATKNIVITPQTGKVTPQ